MAQERRATTPSERFRALLDSITPERLDEIDLKIRVSERLDAIDAKDDPDHAPNEVEWLVDLTDEAMGEDRL